MGNFAYGTDPVPTATQETEDETRPAWAAPLDSFESFVVLSNRQPYRHTYGPDGDIEVDRPTGGLTAALDPVLQRVGGTWIAWGDGSADRAVVDENDRVPVPPEDPAYDVERVWIDDELKEAYYNGYSNRVLWPLCHGVRDAISIRTGDYDGYRAVNERFADRVAAHATPETLVWVQDYHLALAPAMISDRVPSSTTIGQFWHIPWPKPELFSRCPEGREILEGLLGNDVLAFHVDRFVERFLRCVRYFVDGASVDAEDGIVTYEGSETHVRAIPLGIDASEHEERGHAADAMVFESVTETLSIPTTEHLGLGVDRLDYSKGIVARLDAIEALFENQPRWLESFTFVQTATPSRTDIPAYASYGEAVRERVERINDRFATDSWRPIVYSEAYLTRDQLSALYRHADLMLVTSRCDGMNLVSKEYLAASVDESGALCLSERAGAHDELGDDAFSIDPTDVESIWRTMDRALTTPDADRRRRMRRLRTRVFERPLEWWMAAQFDAFAERSDDRSVLSTQYSGDGI
ncbi:Trehalose-6-phosphate synthase [Halovivax ruber XH-70]|uniref:Trehalose-6-phosphate synthase n=1 Tax=Halovivax ruber (strain DSM 18193 / JCM 13892 / XH-70) TaxID=797302 RepID=L0IBE0_HALRX|nr:trehalose-6-phosphate synthase [Halovivax ruber]AGB16138.1 Trehalose-6-phosphate synthase [Halovivax ruber XH-70]